MEGVSILIGGPQGGGLETILYIFAHSLAKEGYDFIFDREYHSNIKGRHSYIHGNIGGNSLTYPLKILACMDAESIFSHFLELEDGFLIYNDSLNKSRIEEIKSMESYTMQRIKKKMDEYGIDYSVNSVVSYLEERNKIIGINFPEIVDDASKKYSLSAKEAARYISSILIGAVSGILNISINSIEYALNKRFKKEIAMQNKYIVEMAYEKSKNFSIKLEKRNAERMVVSGNEAVAMGKIVGGLTFQSYYPITPAADESFFLEENSDVIVIQTEDEISAICSAIGASLAGARAAVATSGPGFSLMVEAIGWAGMNEVPVVITYYQRTGPSTGMPTRGGQEDLLSSVFSSHGEFPKIVVASSSIEEAFYHAVECFNLAEKYQLPVLHLLEKFIANAVASIKVPDFKKVKIERGKIVKSLEKRFAFDGISSRAFLGDAIMWHTGDEHDEYGHISEDAENRIKMQEKRLRKIEIARKEIGEENMVEYEEKGDDFLIVSWGSTKNVIKDALDEIKKDGIYGSFIILKFFSPFPSNYTKKILEKYDKVISVENNYGMQASKIISMETGVKIENGIAKYSGRPIYLNELVEGIKRILKGEKRVVLKYGL